MIRVLIHASELLTGEGLRKKDGRKPLEEDLGRIQDGALVYDDQSLKILWVGSTFELPKRYSRAKKINLRNNHALIPGLIDCHTHLVFAGDRSNEFAARCGGATYEQIANQGGGIISTVKATREASESQLLKIAESRIAEAYRLGVRTIEIKSGYGLSHEAEIKILKVIQQLKKKCAKKYPDFLIQATYLGAHAFPKDRDPEDYIDEICNQTLPEVSKKKLADACDVFIDRGYYSLDQGRLILSIAQKLGLKIKIHADELDCTESASLAAQLGALSADHLLQISQKGILDISSSQTVAVLLPGTAFYLKAEQAPARALINAGASVALSTDFNPGTSMTLHLPAIMTIAALYLGLTRAEIFAAVTYNAAKALGLQEKRGTLEKGKTASFAILPFQRFEEIYYRFAWVPSR